MANPNAQLFGYSYAALKIDMAAGDKKGHLRRIFQHEEFDRVCLDSGVLDVAVMGYFESQGKLDRANR